MKKNNDRLVELRQSESGAIDIATIKKEKISNYWKIVFTKKTKALKKLKNSSLETFEIVERSVKEENELFESLKIYFSTGNMRQDLLEYLYAGDKKLNLKSVHGYGIATIMASSLIKHKSINALYYYYSKYVAVASLNDFECKNEFCRNVVENALLLIADIWDFAVMTEALSETNLEISAIIERIVSDMFSYTNLLMPVRQLRILDLIKNSNALPCVAGIKKRKHFVLSLSTSSFEELVDQHKDKFPAKPKNGKSNKKVYNDNKLLLNAFIEDLHTPWELHKSVLNIKHEEDVDIFNSKIQNLIDSLTTGDLRASEKAKNGNSGENKRLEKILKVYLEKDEDFLGKLASRQTDAIELVASDLDEAEDKSAMLESLINRAIKLLKKPDAISRIKGLSPILISKDVANAPDKQDYESDDEAEYESDDEGKGDYSASGQLDDIISPDDASLKIWEILDDRYKLFLMCFILGCTSKKGFVARLNRYAGGENMLAVKYIPIDIYRIILEKLSGEKLDPVDSYNVALIGDKIKNISKSKACTRDLDFSYRRLKGRADDVLNGEDLSDHDEFLAKQANTIFDELNN